MVSLAPGAALFGERPALIVTAPTFRFWRAVLEGGDLSAPLARRASWSPGSTTVGALAIAAPGAYAIARLPARIRYGIVVALLVTRMFPEFTDRRVRRDPLLSAGLTDTSGASSRHLAGALPFIAWLLVGAFEGVPRDVEAAAAIDGASRLTTLRRVVLPMTAPGLAVAALFAWLYSWNEFLYARLLTTSQNTLPAAGVPDDRSRARASKWPPSPSSWCFRSWPSWPSSSAIFGPAPSPERSASETARDDPFGADGDWLLLTACARSPRWPPPAAARTNPTGRRSRSARPWPRTRGRPSATSSSASGRRAPSP